MEWSFGVRQFEPEVQSTTRMIGDGADQNAKSRLRHCVLEVSVRQPDASAMVGDSVTSRDSSNATSTMPP